MAQFQKKTQAPIARSDSWSNFITGMGTALRDPKVHTFFRRKLFNEQSLREAYREGLAQKIVNIPARDMTRKGIVVEGDKEQLVRSYMEEHGFLNARLNATRWSRLLGGSAILLDIGDGTNQLWRPVREGRIAYVRPAAVYDRYSISWGRQDLDAYGEPEVYSITRFSGGSFRVHRSRLLVYTGMPLPPRDRWENSGWGQSVIESVYEKLASLGSGLNAVDDVLLNFIQEVFGIKGMMELVQDDEGLKALRSRAQIMALTRSTLNATYIDTDGETYTKHASSVSGMDKLIEKQQQMVAAAADIPETKLYGRSPSGQNATGESDLENYYEAIAGMQAEQLQPNDEKLVRLITLAQDAEVPKRMKDWRIVYPPLREQSEKEIAEIRLKESQRVKTLVDAGVLHPKAAATTMFGGEVYSTDFKMAEADIAALDWPERKSKDVETTRNKEGEE